MPETHTSAGTIPLYPATPPVYLLLRYPQGHWGFPKGHLDAGDDSLWSAALRELKEETGLDVENRYEEFREAIDYWFTQDGRRHHKTVYFFGCEVPSRSVSLSEEHDDFGWYNREETLETITYDNEKLLFERWIDYLDNRTRVLRSGGT